jgi:hypothetical protein
MIEKKIGYYIHGNTGCSCCRHENFIEGLIIEENDALDELARHEKYRTVRSQYSSTGIYSLYKAEYEELPDGRIILGNRVFDDIRFHENGSIAEEIHGLGELVISAGKHDYK